MSDTGVDRADLGEALRIAEAALGQAIATSGFGAFELDLRTLNLRLSQGTEIVMGYARGSITRLADFHALVHPDDLPGAIALFEDAQREERPSFEFVYRLRAEGGDYRVMKGTAWCFYGQDGRAERLVGANKQVADIGARDLAERHAQLGTVLNAVPDPMLLVDLAGDIQSINHAAEQVFGYRADVAIGRSFGLLVPPELTGTDAQALGRFIRLARRGASSPPLLTRGRRADGSDVPVELRVEDVSVGEEPMFAISMRDISGQIDAEERLRTLNDELAHSSRVNAMGEMASDIAHELNQPLAAMSNYVEAARLLLAQQQLTDERPMEMLEAAARQTQRAGAIIRRIRKFVTRGEVDVRIEPVEETVRDAVNLVFVGRTQYDVRVNLAFDRRAHYMLADRVQVQQVIVNLLRNSIDALQAVPADSRNILVKVGKSGDMIELSVMDTGPGIPAAVLDQLYEPFRSTKGEGGMGVGLTISRRIVEAHGGQIFVENRREGGACFRFTVPAIDPPDEGDGRP